VIGLTVFVSKENIFMVVKLSYEQLSALRRIDSPTISNAIETFKVRPRVAGYVGYDISASSRSCPQPSAMPSPAPLTVPPKEPRVSDSTSCTSYSRMPPSQLSWSCKMWVLIACTPVMLAR
jgi:hypothetical protein